MAVSADPLCALRGTPEAAQALYKQIFQADAPVLQYKQRRRRAVVTTTQDLHVPRRHHALLPVLQQMTGDPQCLTVCLLEAVHGSCLRQVHGS